ncbi:NUDIX hydrolase [Gayadomonas joobiniege]|uniref:NUDIX hydrolase n=1 Tax=Gayadomonas joobiniege TaxID=1234606 RepID=UPI0003784D02|nr:NUDIX domain-containing protein [Gayadomonas joobiniege]
MFNYQFNQFAGVHLNINTEFYSSDFTSHLKTLLAEFGAANKKVVWLTLAAEQADFVPDCIKLGFEYHNCLPDQITLIYRLQADAYAPFSPTHTVGAGAVVINDKNQILMVRDNFGQYRGFKLPGGHVELGEDIHIAAEREVFEETGIKAEFNRVLGFIHKHPYRYGKSNLYFVCQLEAKTQNTQIQDPNEIAEVRWLDIDEFIQDSEQSEFVRDLVKTIKNNLAHNPGLKLTASVPSQEQGVQRRDLFIIAD